MPRPRIDEDERYINARNRLNAIKHDVDNARIEADELVRKAKARVERETLLIVREALLAGLSRNAIGRLTGKTSNADQIALVEKAMSLVIGGSHDA